MVLSQGGGSVLPQVGYDRFDTVYAQEAVVHPFELWLAVAAFMRQGIAERFPELRAAPVAHVLSGRC